MCVSPNLPRKISKFAGQLPIYGRANREISLNCASDPDISDRSLLGIGVGVGPALVQSLSLPLHLLLFSQLSTLNSPLFDFPNKSFPTSQSIASSLQSYRDSNSSVQQNHTRLTFWCLLTLTL